MADHEVAEAMRLLSALSRGDISPLLETKRILQSIFDRPAPEPAEKRAAEAHAKWDSVEAQVDRLLVAQMQNPIFATDPLPPKGEATPVDPTTDREEPESLDRFRSEPKYHWSPALWKRGATLFGHHSAEEAVQALVTKDGARGAAASEAARNVPRRSTVPRTTGEDSAWESAAMAGLLDVNTLLKGDYKRYVSHVGCTALGSSLAGLQASIRNECFGEGTIPGAVASCGMDAVNLATTGDWARFGRRTSLNAAEGLGTWGGSAAAAWAVGGLGATVGLPVVLPIVGAFAARSTVRCLANMVPGMGGGIKCESDTNEVAPRMKEAAGAMVEDATQLQDALGTMKSSLPEAAGSMVEDATQLRDALGTMKSSLPEAAGSMVEDAMHLRDALGNMKSSLPEAAGSMVKDMAQLQDALRNMKSSLPEAFDRFLGHLRTASQT